MFLVGNQFSPCVGSLGFFFNFALRLWAITKRCAIGMTGIKLNMKNIFKKWLLLLASVWSMCGTGCTIGVFLTNNPETSGQYFLAGFFCVVGAAILVLLHDRISQPER